MASTAYDVSVRKALNNKGIDNSRIGYNNGYTTIDGQNFLKADKLYNGTGFTNQTNFNTAFNSYSAASKPSITAVAGTVRPTVTAPRTSTTNTATTGGTGFTAPKAPMTPTTAPMPGSVQIRPALEASGINPNAIGYNNATRSVTVNGQPFTTPSQSINGTAYATPSQYQGALNNYRVGDLQNQVYNYKTAENPYTKQIDDTIAYLMDYAKQQQVSDPYSTPEYAAYAAQSGRRASQGIRAAQEAFGGAGFGRSTALGERAQGVQNGETEYLETQVIPAILAAEQQRKQAQYNNVSGLLNPLAVQQNSADAREQSRFTNLYNTLISFADEKQRGVQNAQADAALTGSYQTPEQQTLYNSLLAIKQQAEAKGITKDQRAVLSAQADQLRTQLQSLGVDISALGVGSSSSAAAKANPFRTIQGQQLDLQNKQTNIDTALRYGEQAGRLLTPQSDPSGYLRQVQKGAPLNYTAQQDRVTNAQEDRRIGQTDRSLTESERSNRAGEQYNQDRLSFDKDSFKQEFSQRQYEFGEEQAIRWAGQYLNEAQLEEVKRANQAGESIDLDRLAETVRSNMENEAQGWTGLDLDGQRIAMGGSGSGGGGYSGLTQSQIIDSIKDQFAVEVPVYDEDGDQTGTKTQYPKNKDATTKDSIYQSVIGYGLPANEEDQTLLALGLTQKDIADLDKKYAASTNAPTGGGGSAMPNTITQASFKSGGGGGGLQFTNGTAGYNNYYKAQKFVGTNNFNQSGAAVAQAIKNAGYPGEWLAPALELVARESSFNPNAANPKSTARGIFQFLDATRKNYGGANVDWSDPYQQAVAGLKYIKDRYGTPTKALQHWDAKKWY